MEEEQEEQEEQEEESPDSVEEYSGPLPIYTGDFLQLSELDHVIVEEEQEEQEEQEEESPDSDITRLFVPSSISGSNAHARSTYLDLCRSDAGMPHLFLTLTTNECTWDNDSEFADLLVPVLGPVTLGNYYLLKYLTKRDE